MGNFIASSTKNSYFRGIQTILVGGVFLFFPGLTIKTVMIIIGSMLVASGLISMVISNRKRRGGISGLLSSQGILNVLFGIVFITSPAVMVKIFMIFIGIILLILGLLQLFGAIGMLSRSLWAWIFLILGLVTFSSAVYLLSDPFKSAETILPFLGAILILNGISQFIMAWKIGRRPPNYKGSDVQDIPYEEV